MKSVADFCPVKKKTDNPDKTEEEQAAEDEGVPLNNYEKTL